MKSQMTQAKEAQNMLGTGYVNQIENLAAGYKHFYQ